MAIVKKTQISIDINMDENNIPEEIKWTAPDGGILNMNTKAILLSFWDSENQESLKMDLWVKEMPLDEMKVFFFQILSSLAKTYEKATQDEKMTKTMLDFCDYFAEKLELKK